MGKKWKRMFQVEEEREVPKREFWRFFIWVVVNSEEERLSFALFYNPKRDKLISPLPELVAPNQPPLYLAITFEQYRMCIRKRGPKGKSQVESLKNGNGLWFIFEANFVCLSSDPIHIIIIIIITHIYIYIVGLCCLIIESPWFKFEFVTLWLMLKKKCLLPGDGPSKCELSSPLPFL